MPRPILLVACSLLLVGCPDPPQKTVAVPPPRPMAKTAAAEGKTPGWEGDPHKTKTAETLKPPPDGFGIQAQSKDIVCGKMVSLMDGVAETWGNEKFHFCSPECAAKFKESPKIWVKKRDKGR